MLPGINFNPSIANLTALHGMGGFPHPLGPVRAPLPVAPMPFNRYPGMNPNPAQPLPMPPMPIGPNGISGMPHNPVQPMNGLNNLQAIRQLLGLG